MLTLQVMLMVIAEFVDIVNGTWVSSHKGSITEDLIVPSEVELCTKPASFSTTRLHVAPTYVTQTPITSCSLDTFARGFSNMALTLLRSISPSLEAYSEPFYSTCLVP